MIANFFSKTKPIHAVLVGGLFLFFFVLAILVVERPVFSWNFFFEKLGLSIAFLCLFFVVRFINRKNNLTDQNSYVLLVLALLFATYPATMQYSNVFVAHFLLLLAFRRIYSLRTFKSIKQKLFDAGFWIGIATVFFNWSILFFLLIPVATIVYKKQSIRHFIIPIVGFVTPFFLLFTYYYWIDNATLMYQFFYFEIGFSLIAFVQPAYMIAAITISALLIIGIVVVSFRINSQSNEFGQSWLLLLVHFVLAWVVLLLSANKEGTEVVVIFLPATFILANLLQQIPGKVLKEVMIFGMLALAMHVYLTA
ncbi:hypothetical protein KH5_13570 [Urechidicola sp. KH5]